MARQIVILGGTGLIGSLLTRHFQSVGDTVYVVGRHTRPALTEGHTDAWTETLHGADAVINLCGSSVARKHTPERQAELLASRVGPTQTLAWALQEAHRRPEVWLNASAVGVFGNRGDEELTEDSAPGAGFLPELCRQWESACLESPVRVRKVTLRLGVVLSRLGGAFPELARIPAGGIGDGSQFFPWIHQDDVCGLVEWAVSHPVSGPMNAVAPGTVTNREFFAALGKRHLPRLRGRVFRQIAEWTGMEASVALEGQRVLPKKALESGYRFVYPEVGEAVRDLRSRTP